MFKSFIISINHHKKIIYKTSALLCLTTSIGYLWNSNIVSKPIYASEGDLEFKKLKCKKLIKRFKVSLIELILNFMLTISNEGGIWCTRDCHWCVSKWQNYL
jgi:hypothetical protein